MLVGLYLVGWIVNHVLGRRLFSTFEAVVERLPMIQKEWRMNTM